MLNESITHDVAELPRGPDLIGRAHELLGAPFQTQDLHADSEHELGQLDALSIVAEKSGLRTEKFVAPPLALFSTQADRRPLLTLDSGGHPILLTELKGRRVRIEEDGKPRSWIDVKQLSHRLGLEHAGVEHAWLSLETAESKSIPLIEGSPWGSAIALLRGERTNVAAIIIYAVGVGLMSLALPLAVQIVVNTVAFGQQVQPILLLTSMLGIGLAFAAILRSLQAWTVELVQRRLFVNLVSELAVRLPRVHVKAFERGHGPELVNRFFDVFTAQKAVASILLGGVEALLTTLVGLVLLAFYHPALLGFGLVLIMGAFLVFVALGRGATRTTILESKAKYAVAGWLEEMVRHLFALKMAGGADYARRRLDALAVDWLQHRAAHFRVYYRQYVGALGLQVAAHASLLGLGGWLVVERQLTIGQLVAAELIVTAIVDSLSKLGGKLDAVYDLVAAADKLSALLGLELEDSGGDEVARGHHASRVVIKGIDSAGGELTNFNLNIEPGTRMAVHGDRKASTALADILFGLRLPTRGTVFIDDIDLRDLRLEALRSRVAVVREPELLPGSVADNIRAAGRPVPSSEIWAILEETGLAETIRNLPQGLKTEILPSGAPLDRLGALRLTLARALAGHPALLILDGFIDALPEYERKPILENVNQGRTLIVLTHEQAIIDHCKTCVEFTIDLPNLKEKLS